MTVHVLLIKQKAGVTLAEVEQYLRTEFTSEEYMRGFLSGYLFNDYSLLTLQEYEDKVNNLSPMLSTVWVKFLKVCEVQDEE